MATAQISVFDKFNNTYVATDPDYVKGLELYRLVLAPPIPRDITGLGAILPIVAATQRQNQTINVSFSIVDLPNSMSSTVESQAFNLLQLPLSELPGFAPQGQTIQTVLPVRHVSKAGGAVLFFDITSLQRVEILSNGNRYSSYGSNPRHTRISVKPYNKSSGVNITSDPPMVDSVVGDTATFSFDITELPRI